MDTRPGAPTQVLSFRRLVHSVWTLGLLPPWDTLSTLCEFGPGQKASGTLGVITVGAPYFAPKQIVFIEKNSDDKPALERHLEYFCSLDYVSSPPKTQCIMDDGMEVFRKFSQCQRTFDLIVADMLGPASIRKDFCQEFTDVTLPVLSPNGRLVLTTDDYTMEEMILSLLAHPQTPYYYLLNPDSTAGTYGLVVSLSPLAPTEDARGIVDPAQALPTLNHLPRYWRLIEKRAF